MLGQTQYATQAEPKLRLCDTAGIQTCSGCCSVSPLLPTTLPIYYLWHRLYSFPPPNSQTFPPRAGQSEPISDIRLCLSRLFVGSGWTNTVTLAGPISGASSVNWSCVWLAPGRLSYLKPLESGPVITALELIEIDKSTRVKRRGVEERRPVRKRWTSDYCGCDRDKNDEYTFKKPGKKGKQKGVAT